jgi:guanylate kinase
MAQQASSTRLIVPADALLFVVSAPSGGGKRTIIARVQERAHGSALQYSVSATSRRPRRDEVDGKDYIFLDREAFESRVAADEFVEWAEVHGNLYGTLKSQLARCLAGGGEVLLEVDVQGMRSLRHVVENVVTIFVMPPSLEALEARLRGRGANDDADLALRLANAREEMASCYEFDYIIVNDNLDEAVADFEAIVRAQRRRADVVRARERRNDTSRRD